MIFFVTVKIKDIFTLGRPVPLAEAFAKKSLGLPRLKVAAGFKAILPMGKGSDLLLSLGELSKGSQVVFSRITGTIGGLAESNVDPSVLFTYSLRI